jgi:predicted ArsR family transcriptional regulator
MINASQPGLFDNPLPQESGRARRQDPDTSKKAAARVPVADLEQRVLRALQLSKAGMTTHELAWLLKVDLVSVSPRMRPLTEKGLVRDSGERRRGDSGRASIVWKASA